jgi:hypothetical protein
MRANIQSICESTQRSPIGWSSLILGSISGVTYFTSVLLPLLLRGTNFPETAGRDTRILVIVVGSGFAFLMALLSLGLERHVGPAVIALCVLAATEYFVFPVIPFWMIMLLGAWSGWAALAYITGFIAAGVVIVRRVITGEAVIRTPLQFSRCPLVGALRKL